MGEPFRVWASLKVPRKFAASRSSWNDECGSEVLRTFRNISRQVLEALAGEPRFAGRANSTCGAEGQTWFFWYYFKKTKMNSSYIKLLNFL